MGYNTHLMKTGSIPAKSAAAGIAVLQVLMANLDQRITVPYLRLHTGAAGGNLAILQTEGVYRFTQGIVAGANITILGIPAGLATRHVVVRDQNGECKHYEILSQAGESLTLNTSIPANTKCMLYLLGTDASPHTGNIPLAVNGSTILEADCPGVITGKEIGWPVGLFLRNTDGDAEIESGNIAYINV